MTRDETIALIISLEGGYVDNPADPGGKTNMGITQRYLDRAVAADPSLPTHVADLTVAQVTGLYQRDQWAAVHGDALPPALAALAFDSAVNEGPGAAATLLQQALNVPVDGVIGSGTIAAAGRAPASVAGEYAARRAAHYAHLNKDTFELGWMRRLFRVYTAAIR